MNSEAELTVIKKSNLCFSSLETVPVSRPPFSSAFWDFHKMHQDTEATFQSTI